MQTEVTGGVSNVFSLVETFMKMFFVVRNAIVGTLLSYFAILYIVLRLPAAKIPEMPHPLMRTDFCDFASITYNSSISLSYISTSATIWE